MSSLVLISVPERPVFKESEAPACDWGAFITRLDSGGENGELEGDSVLIGSDESGLLVEDREGSLRSAMASKAALFTYDG